MARTARATAQGRSKTSAQVEKFLFILMTAGLPDRAGPIAAGVTAVSLTGWLSVAGAALSPRGALPVDEWLCALPGAFLGSACGPSVARRCGASAILSVFTLVIGVDAARTLSLAALPLLRGGV